jgi:hypothetical protein
MLARLAASISDMSSCSSLKLCKFRLGNCAFPPSSVKEDANYKIKGMVR